MLRKHKRLTKKELKKDPFVIFTAQVYEYLQNEWKKLGSIVLTVVVVISLGIFFAKSSKKSEINAYDAALTALQNDAPEAPDLLKAVVEKHGGSDKAGDALIRLGNLYYQQKDYDLSEKYFSQYVKKYSGDPLYDLNAYNGLGVVYEEKGEYKKAADTYKQYISKYKESPFDTMMWLNIAKAYWLAGEKQASKEYFTKIVDKPYDSSEKQEALYYLEMLNLNKI
ncbi:MAG: tetratricopeptide repeat protein [Candidatus Latescibacteria bacterium]|nr:tetratricopeptide repeat protein [Candidatus Latescibacterota bacterium]